jgi:hypothetical protein
MDFLNEEEDLNGIAYDEIIQLNNAWQTEVHAPEILPFREELVEEISEQLQRQQTVIDEKVDNPFEIFTAGLYQMDIERVRYALSRYLRTRILKIEKMLETIVSRVDVLDNLSKHEKIFAAKLNNLNNSYMEETFFNRLQEGGLKESVELSDDRLQHSQPTLKVMFAFRIKFFYVCYYSSFRVGASASASAFYLC